MLTDILKKIAALMAEGKTDPVAIVKSWCNDYLNTHQLQEDTANASVSSLFAAQSLLKQNDFIRVCLSLRDKNTLEEIIDVINTTLAAKVIDKNSDACAFLTAFFVIYFPQTAFPNFAKHPCLDERIRQQLIPPAIVLGKFVPTKVKQQIFNSALACFTLSADMRNSEFRNTRLLNLATFVALRNSFPAHTTTKITELLPTLATNDLPSAWLDPIDSEERSRLSSILHPDHKNVTYPDIKIFQQANEAILNRVKASGVQVSISMEREILSPKNHEWKILLENLLKEKVVADHIIIKSQHYIQVAEKIADLLDEQQLHALVEHLCVLLGCEHGDIQLAAATLLQRLQARVSQEQVIQIFTAATASLATASVENKILLEEQYSNLIEAFAHHGSDAAFQAIWLQVIGDMLSKETYSRCKFAYRAFLAFFPYASSEAVECIFAILSRRISTDDYFIPTIGNLLLRFNSIYAVSNLVQFKDYIENYCKLINSSDTMQLSYLLTNLAAMYPSIPQVFLPQLKVDLELLPVSDARNRLLILLCTRVFPGNISPDFTTFNRMLIDAIAHEKKYTFESAFNFLHQNCTKIPPKHQKDLMEQLLNVDPSNIYWNQILTLICKMCAALPDQYVGKVIDAVAKMFLVAKEFLGATKENHHVQAALVTLLQDPENRFAAEIYSRIIVPAITTLDNNNSFMSTFLPALIVHLSLQQKTHLLYGVLAPKILSESENFCSELYEKLANLAGILYNDIGSETRLLQRELPTDLVKHVEAYVRS